MTFVVTEACIRCKYTDCVDVCPVDCIIPNPDHAEDKDQLQKKFLKLTAGKA